VSNIGFPKAVEIAVLVGREGLVVDEGELRDRLSAGLQAFALAALSVCR
jgi:hypothetical protein